MRIEMLEATAGYPVLGARPAFLDRGHRAVAVYMTGAATITQFASSVFNVGILVLLVRPQLVIAGVATRTVWLECGVPPGDQFGVGLMASSAQQVAAVILWFVGQGHVAVVSGRPRVRDVAGIAFLCGAEVTRVLTDRCYAIVTG